MIENWEGYLEHRSEASLDSPRENTGKGGYTIFAEMVRKNYGADFQGKSWCVTFLFAVHPGMIGKPCTGVITLARRMIRHLRWRRKTYRPSRGDLVFLRNSRREVIGHAGIVLSSDETSVTSIEGNAVDPSGVFSPSEGGAVSIRARSRDDFRIVGYASMRGRMSIDDC